MPPVPGALTRPRAALAAVLLAAGLALTVVAPTAAAQVPPTTAPGGVLVPGTTAPAGAPTTTVPPTSTSSPAEDEGGVLDFDFDANEKVWIIVGALVAVSVLLLVLTVLYWRHTRPDRDAKAAHKEAKARAKADARADAKARRRERRAADEPVEDREDDADQEEPAAASDGPMDLDGLLQSPDPSRSIFGDPDPPSR